MKLKQTSSKTILPELRLKKRTIDKENAVNESFSYKQLILKSQRMSQVRTRQGGSINCHSRKLKSITKDKDKEFSIIKHQTISVQPLKPLLGNHTPIPSLLSNLNHKLIQQPNIHIWSKLAKQIQKQNDKTLLNDKKTSPSWQTLYRNLDTKINGQECCFKISKRRQQSLISYYIIIIKFNQKIHISFNEKEWRKICKIYRTYRELEDCVSLSCDNKIVLPLNLESEEISEHVKREESVEDCGSQF